MTIKEAQAVLDRKRGVICTTTSSPGREEMDALGKQRSEHLEATTLISETLPCVGCKWSKNSFRRHPDARWPQWWLMCTNPKVRIQWSDMTYGKQSDDKFCYRERDEFSGGEHCGASGKLWESK